MDDQPPRALELPPRERGDDAATAPPRPAPPPTPEPRGSGRSALWLLLLLLIIAGLVVWVVLHAGQQTAPAGRFRSSGPMPVGTATAAKADMPVILTGLGTVTPLATVTVKTQINGQLVDVAFKEGQIVHKGDVLAQIDPRPYQVALEQAQAQLAKDTATLNNDEVNLKRYRTLVAQNSIAKQTMDTQVATVAQDQATLKADQAQIDVQKLNLTYAHITSPITGRVGLRQVDPGNYVQTSDAGGIVVITQLQPISVIFTLPEDQLREVLRRLHAGTTLQVTAFDRTGATKLDTGQLETVDNQIDTSTGTAKLRATFSNPEQILFPNQFVNVQLLVNTLDGVTVVPTSAVQRGAPGTFVYLVKPDDTVAAQPVTLGPSDEQRVAVTKGLQPGQVVVTDGADRLKEGAKVRLAGAAGRGEAAARPAAAGDGAAKPAPAGGKTAPASDHPHGQRRQRTSE
jgi:multidrug efflux system membrane fusion protein